VRRLVTNHCPKGPRGVMIQSRMGGEGVRQWPLQWGNFKGFVRIRSLDSSASPPRALTPPPYTPPQAGSGYVKLACGDPTWRDLSALSYHFLTQPLPSPLAPRLLAQPPAVNRAGTAFGSWGELLVRLPPPLWRNDLPSRSCIVRVRSSYRRFEGSCRVRCSAPTPPPPRRDRSSCRPVCTGAPADPVAGGVSMAEEGGLCRTLAPTGRARGHSPGCRVDDWCSLDTELICTHISARPFRARELHF
jgi:hypothetical protein